MIAVVEVGLCFQRPPTEQKVRRVIVSGETETECELTAIHLALCPQPPYRRPRAECELTAAGRVPEGIFTEPTMPVSVRIVELLAY